MDERKLTKEQKEKMKKYAVFGLMGIICAGCIGLIFMPSAKEKAQKEQMAGFNADIPMPKDGNMINDKREAYEEEQMKQKQAERMRSLQDFSSLFGDSSTAKKEIDLSLMSDNAVSPNSAQSKREETAPVQKSVNAYKDINRSLGNFYETPKKDTEKEALKQQVEELQAKVHESQNSKNEEDRQLKIMKKSMQIAAKYMPGAAAVTGAPPVASKESPVTGGNATGKYTVVPVTEYREKTVSMLQPEMTATEFMEAYSQPRNLGFLTAATDTVARLKNTVGACIHADQTLMDGQYVRLRLLEPVKAGNIIIPSGTLLSGLTKIQGERMQVSVNMLEYAGMIIPVNLKAYDTDGQPGIFIPNLQELNAAKEIVANMGTSTGMNINLSGDAGKQFASDMGRNAIQGVSQYMGKKLREVKVHLKAGYMIFLMPEKS